MRRILIILLVILLIGAGIWFFYIKPKQTGTSSPVSNALKSFFPTSTTSTGSFGSDTVPGTLNGSSSQISSSSPSLFQQVSARAIAGYSVFTLTTTISTPPTTTNPSSTKTKVVTPTVKPTVQTNTDHYIRYVSRQNGYVYEVKDDGTPLQITNILIPNVYEAYFMDSNNTAIERFLRDNQKTIATYSIPIPPLNSDNSRTQQSGTYLPDDIFEVAVSPDQTQLARITTDRNGAILTTSSSLGTKIKTLLRNPFTEWLPSWVGNTIYLQTKAASIADGFLYSVTGNARLNRLLGNIAGLTTSVSPDSTYILYSQSTTSGFRAFLLNTKTNITNPIDLSILPEKCAWLQNENLICAGNSRAQSAVYPDAWYAGTIHFTDQLYQINLVNNLYTVLYDGSQQAFDMTNLQVDEGRQLLYFTDKSTGYLWRFKY